MRKILFLVLILGVVLLVGCSTKQIEEIHIELYPDGDYAEVEVHTNQGAEELTLQTVDEDQIIEQLANKYGLSKEEISSKIEYEEDEEEEEEHEETGSQGTAPQPNTVEITSTGFNPSTLTINQGETVTFVNKDASAHWPASNPHPIHIGYPETGGCIGSKFDACHGLVQDEAFTFIFNEKGTWGYHDHMHTSLMGNIVVQ